MSEWDEASRKAESLRATLGDPAWLTAVLPLAHPDWDSTKVYKPALYVAYHPGHEPPTDVPTAWEGLDVFVIEDQIGQLQA